jgi:hypothetical protein
MHRSRHSPSHQTPQGPEEAPGQRHLFAELNAPTFRGSDKPQPSIEQRYREQRPAFASLPEVSAKVSELGRIYRFLDRPRDYKMTPDDCILCIECYSQVMREARRGANMSREPRLHEPKKLSPEDLACLRETLKNCNFVDCLTSLAFTHASSKVRLSAIDALKYTFPANVPTIMALANLAHYKAAPNDHRRAERIAAMHALEEMPISAMYGETMLKQVIPKVIRQVDDPDPSIQSCAFRISALLTEHHLGIDAKGEQINSLRRTIMGRAASKLREVLSTMAQADWTLPDIGHGALHAILILAPALSRLAGNGNERETAKAVLEKLYRPDTSKRNEQ